VQGDAHAGAIVADGAGGFGLPPRRALRIAGDDFAGQLLGGWKVNKPDRVVIEIVRVEEGRTRARGRNSAGGWRLATSIDGRGTGEHPDFIVWDDPHNVNDAESQVERERVIAWRAATISLRGMTRDVRETTRR
jgi:hypothetical protein